VCADERISAWSTHGFRDTRAFGMDDQVSSSGVDGRSRGANEEYDPGDLRAARSDDSEGTCGERPSASVCVDTAAGNDQPIDTMVEGEDVVSRPPWSRPGT
jgi:hypothetical protein